MSFFNVFIDVLFSPLGLPFWMGIGACIGVFVGMWLTRPKKNQVNKLVPSDKRGFDLDVEEENANFIYTTGIETLPPQRFLKFRPGYTITQRRRFGKWLKINRYFAREGTAYAQRIESGEVENIPLALVLKAMWGEDDYDIVKKNAPELIAMVETGLINVTVELEDDPLTPEGMKTISEENIKTEEDKQASSTFWKEKSKAMRESFIHNFAYIGTGIAIGVIMSIVLGWIQLGPGPTPPAN